MKPHECPHCHIALDDATDSLDPLGHASRERGPKAGDFIVCFECGGVSFATDAEGGRRLPTEDESVALDKDRRVIAVRAAREEWEIVQRCIRSARSN